MIANLHMKVSRWQEPLPALVHVSLVQLQVFLHFWGRPKIWQGLAIQTSQWIHKYVPNLKILRDRNLQVILNDPDAIFLFIVHSHIKNCIIRQVYRPQDLKVQVGFLYPNKKLPRPICSLWEWEKNDFLLPPSRLESSMKKCCVLELSSLLSSFPYKMGQKSAISRVKLTPLVGVLFHPSCPFLFSAIGAPCNLHL